MGTLPATGTRPQDPDRLDELADLIATARTHLERARGLALCNLDPSGTGPVNCIDGRLREVELALSSAWSILSATDDPCSCEVCCYKHRYPPRRLTYEERHAALLDSQI